MAKMGRTLRYAFYGFMAMLFAAAGATVNSQDWRRASREPVGLAPDPAVVKAAVVQVYGARAVGAKGLFGVHTWIAVKPTDAPTFTIYEANRDKIDDPDLIHPGQVLNLPSA